MNISVMTWPRQKMLRKAPNLRLLIVSQNQPRSFPAQSLTSLSNCDKYKEVSSLTVPSNESILFVEDSLSSDAAELEVGTVI